MANKKADNPLSPPAVATFRDTRFISRQVFTTGMRPLPVAAGRVAVPTTDAEAIACLERHPDFERVE